MALYISRIHIKNIRCFENITIDLEQENKPVLWVTLLGDNATGKTTLLRCIAIGLCDESSAAGLLRESEKGYIRRNSNKDGIIEITLNNSQKPHEFYKIITRIIKIKYRNETFENLRQYIKRQSFINKEFEDIKVEDFPWRSIFISAYGIGRGSSGTGDISGYSPISAVYNLFNYSEGLQNPELVLRRLGNDAFKDKIMPLLKSILNLKDEDKIFLEREGIEVDGPWGKRMPLRDLADGYRSTFQWVLDLIGWAASRNVRASSKIWIRGIVLIDSLEEHLHPRWQRTIVNDLNKVFPDLQFIITTHSPLVAAGTTDIQKSQLISLELDSNTHKTRWQNISKIDMQGRRADEILRSEAFGLLSTTSLGSVNDLTKYCELLNKVKRNEKEEFEFNILREKVKDKYTFGDTYFEREVERAVLMTLKKLLRRKPEEIHKLETKKQLAKIFGDNDAYEKN